MISFPLGHPGTRPAHRRGGAARRSRRYGALLPVHPPLVCPLRTATGIPCPFCGMTRAVVAGVHGDILGSLRFNPAGLLVIALAVFIVVRPRLPRGANTGVDRRAAARALWVYNIG